MVSASPSALRDLPALVQELDLHEVEVPQLVRRLPREGGQDRGVGRHRMYDASAVSLNIAFCIVFLK